MEKVEKFILSLWITCFLLIPLGLIFRYDSILINKRFAFGLALIFAISVALSIFFLPKRKVNTSTIKKIFVYICLIPAFGLCGWISGDLSSNLIFGSLAKVSLNNSFSNVYTCVKSDRIRRIGIVNWLKDEKGTVYRLEGYDALCGFGIIKSQNKYILSGRESVFGRIVKNVRLLKAES